MVQTGIQLYTLRDTDLTLPEQITTVADIGFDGVEFAGLDDTQVDDVAAACERIGIDVPAAHVTKDDLDTAFDDAVERYQQVGCDHLIIPYVDEDRYASKEQIDDLAHELADIADRLADHGMAPGYHNHAHEFAPLPDHSESAFHYFVDAVDGVAIELDVGWATAAGYDPVDLIERWADDIYAVHITDVAEQRPDTVPARIGDGIVDISGCVDAIEAAGIGWQFYEHEALDDAIDTLPAEYRTLQSYTGE